ncbi:MAG: glycosyl transferase [Microbacterium sp.]
MLATLMIGAGIAQRTIFQGPRTSTTAISVEGDAPYLLIDGAVLNTLPGTQTLRAHGDGDIFAAYGRTADMEDWLADTPYTHVTLDDEALPQSELVEPEVAVDPAATPTPAPTAETGTAEETPARSPLGSDLWLDEFQQADVLIAPLQLPAEMSVLVAADGTEPAPTDVSISWPIGNGTPWAGPLIVAGAIVMAVGVFLYILGIRHARRARGPRRKGLPVPMTEPIDLAVEQADKGVISAGQTRKSLGTSRKAFIAIPAVAVSALLFAGCSADSWPQFGETATPSPTASVIVPEGQDAPAVTKAQAERILSRIAQTTADADAAMDPTLAATRLDGAVLAARATNYTLRSAITDYAAPAAVLTKPLEIVLPQSYDEWPRSVLAVVDDKATKTSSIMIMTQADPWAPYKLTYQASLEASTLMPDLAASYVGAPQVQPDSPFLIMPPDQVAAAYADVIDKGDASAYAGIFDAETDHLRPSIAADRQRRLDDFNQTGTNTGQLTFAAVPGTFDPFAIATLESGAIVAVNIHEVENATPTNADAVIKLPNSPTVKALAGADQSPTGFTTTYTDQLFFYVPGQGSSEKIRLLGYGSSLLDAKVIK